MKEDKAMPFTPPNAAVWFEIPVSDLDAAIAFYSKVCATTLTKEQMGPNVTAIFAYNGGVSGHLYEGKPSGDGTGPTVHLAVPGTLEDAMARCSDSGGTVVSPAIQIPPGRFAYATDPDGNSLGLFEPAK
jgi:predicted enzyme related to lactoylglutathione lyase